MKNYDLLILYSGGADSRLMIEFSKMINKNPYCLMIDYGQKHLEELQFAERQLKELNIDFQKIKISGLGLNSYLTGNNIGGRFGDNISEYHVPGRNTMFAGIAFSIAENLGIKEIWIGADWSDVLNNFVDCKQDFINKVNELFKVNGSFPIEFKAPLLGLEKQTILNMLKNIGVNREDIYSGYGEDNLNKKEYEFNKFEDLIENIDEFLSEYNKDNIKKNKYDMKYNEYISLPSVYHNIDLDGKIIIVEGLYRLEGHDAIDSEYGILYDFDSTKKISPEELDNYIHFCNIIDLNDDRNNYIKVQNSRNLNMPREKYFYLDSIKFDKNKTYYDVLPGVYRLGDNRSSYYGIIYRFTEFKRIHKNALKNYEYVCNFI